MDNQLLLYTYAAVMSLPISISAIYVVSNILAFSVTGDIIKNFQRDGFTNEKIKERLNLETGFPYRFNRRGICYSMKKNGII